MSIPQNSFQFSNYLPAVFKKYKHSSMIEYYVENPITHKLVRKHIKVNRLIDKYTNKKEAERHISRMVTSINVKLSGGWNPFFESEDARLYTPIVEVSKLFLAEKEKEQRERTFSTYKSFISIFVGFVNVNCSGCYSSMFTQVFASRFLDYVYNQRNVSARSYNNYLKLSRMFFNWMKEKCYCKENPFEKISPKKKHDKKRIMIPQETRQQIITYLQITDPHFLIVCKLIYYSLIRPNEIRHIQIENIYLDKHYIVIPGKVAKNHKTRFAALTPDLVEDLKKMNLERFPAKYYLFGANLQPDKTNAPEARFRKNWDKLRNRLNLPQEMQLYSFRDTGIFEMLKVGIDDLTVMQHADHSSLDITSIYANHADSNLTNIIYDKAPKF